MNIKALNLTSWIRLQNIKNCKTASILVACALLLGNQPAFAVTQYWDTSTAAGLNGGAATWDINTTAEWSATTAPTAGTPLNVWTDGNDATFQASGTANDVAVSGTVITGNLVQNGSGVVTTLNGGTILVNTAITNNVSTAAFTVNSAITLGVGASSFVTVTSGNTNTVVLNGNIGETGGARGIRVGSGVGNSVILSGNNNFSAGIQQNAASTVTAMQAASLGLGTVGLSSNAAGSTTLNLNFATNGTAANAVKFNLGGSGAAGAVNIKSTGTAAVNFSNTSAISFGSLVGGSNTLGLLTINFGGASTAANQFSSIIKDSGTGLNVTSIAKSDAGKWTLTGTNINTGATSVTSGELATGATGTFGAGNVSVGDNSILTLGNNASIGNASTLTFTSLSDINLDFIGTEIIGSLFDSTTSTYMAIGTYTFTDLNDFFGGSVFSGTGLVNVTTAVPEPATWVMVVGGFGLLLMTRRTSRRLS